MQNRRLDLTGLAKPSESRGLTGMRPGSHHQDAADQVFGQFLNRTEPLFRSTPGPLAGHLDLLLTLGVVHPLSSNTLAGMILYPRNEINIFISCLLPDLGSGEACYSGLGVIESLEWKGFRSCEVLMTNCLLTQLWSQWVVNNWLVRPIL